MTLYSCGAIHRNKADLISQIYKIMVVIMLNNKRRRYFDHYIIIFIGFIHIYYAINLNIISPIIFYFLVILIIRRPILSSTY